MLTQFPKLRGGVPLKSLAKDLRSRNLTLFHCCKHSVLGNAYPVSLNYPIRIWDGDVPQTFLKPWPMPNLKYPVTGAHKLWEQALLAPTSVVYPSEFLGEDMYPRVLNHVPNREQTLFTNVLWWVWSEGKNCTLFKTKMVKIIPCFRTLGEKHSILEKTDYQKLWKLGAIADKTSSNACPPPPKKKSMAILIMWIGTSETHDNRANLNG